MTNSICISSSFTKTNFCMGVCRGEVVAGWGGQGLLKAYCTGEAAASVPVCEGHVTSATAPAISCEFDLSCDVAVSCKFCECIYAGVFRGGRKLKKIQEKRGAFSIFLSPQCVLYPYKGFN